VQSSNGRDDLLIQVADVGARYSLTIDPLVLAAGSHVVARCGLIDR
jgi:hypothetical protein